MNVSELLREFELSPIPKQEIPGIIGALESIKAKLFLQLCQPIQNASSKTPEQLLTVPEAAKRLRLTEQYVYSLIRQRELSAVRQGRYVRLRESDLNAWISK
jgi:excisionase family DNA binding protein